MDDDIKQFWISFRASLLQEAKVLQDQRAAKLQQAAEILRMIDNTKPIAREPTHPVTKNVNRTPINGGKINLMVDSSSNVLE